MMQASQYDLFVNNRVIKFLEALERRDPVAGQLFVDDPWEYGEGDTTEFSIGALSAIAGTVGERQRIPSVNPAQSTTLLKRQLQYGQAFEITKRMAKFNKWKDADYYANQAAMGIMDGFDYDLTHEIFSQAENLTFSHRTEGTFTNSCIDGVAPASASHTVTGTGGTLYPNIVNSTTGLALSTDNLVTAKQLPNQNAVDEYGTPLKALYNQLVITQNEDMIRKGKQIFGSPKEPEVFENGINIYSDGSQTLIVLTHGDTTPALAFDSTRRYRWFLKAESLRELNRMKKAQNPQPALESIDENNLAARVVGDMFGAKAIAGWQDKVYSLNQVAP